MTKKKALSPKKKSPAKQDRCAQRPLTTKQQRFVDFYDGNATEAARKAGYRGNESSLSSIGEQNLRKLEIKKAIQKREEKRNKLLIADREERQQFWTDGMRDTKADRKDRQKDSELLGRSEADFTDNQRISDPDGKALRWKVEIVKPEGE